MSREWRIMAAVEGHGVPVPACIAYCDDLEVNGAPFYVMGFVDGLILRDRASVGAMTAEQADIATDSLIDVQIAFHTIDIDAVGLGTLGILDAERDAPGANITSVGDAVWWSWATVTTVGYGDRYPVTLAGRGVAAVLMLCGIALLGLVTAALASWLVDRYQDEDEEEDQARDEARFAALHEELRALRAEIRELHGRSAPDPATPET